MTTISTAVVLAAGLGTRLLPATKAVPKEMLPVVEKPIIQYAVEEAVAAGITEIIFVVAEGKEAITEHFGNLTRVEAHARDKGDTALLEQVQHPSRLAHYQYVLQDRPLGIAHAVACARQFVEGQAFALIFPDDLILSEQPCIGQLIGAFELCGGSVIAVEEVQEADIPSYGIVHPADDRNPARLKGLLEKPAIADAPSNLGIVGRYVLSASIFEHIDQLQPGKNGELQLTDALASQLAAGEPVCSYRYEGVRYDTGRPIGLLVASIAVALQREDLRRPLLERLVPMLETGAGY